jgi:hypothetical protein
MDRRGVMPGVADWIIAEPWKLGDHEGDMIAIELKAPKGRLSGAQHAFLAKCTCRGWLCAIARSMADFEDILQHVLPMNGRTFKR